MRETYRKFKIFFETAFETFDATFQTRETSFAIYNATFQINETSFAAPIINNVKIVIIIYFIVELCDIIAKPSYNFRN